jgi:hypothetical protein
LERNDRKKPEKIIGGIKTEEQNSPGKTEVCHE